MWKLGCLTILAVIVADKSTAKADDSFTSISLQSSVNEVQPMTGIVLWNTNSQVNTAPIQLEYCYLKYDQIVDKAGNYDWAPLEKLLTDVASRKHQAIIRWHDTYVGKPTGVPLSIKSLSDYRETSAKSENKRTGFPDWSHPELRRFILEFFTRFTKKFDNDPRLAFVQVGFGLWAEYHIYDGPMKLGKTFPSRDFQAKFARHLDKHFRETPWMISVDAAGDHAPFAKTVQLRRLSFGLFDDSFNHADHQQENEPNWKVFGTNRWRKAPAGGEFSFFERVDQKAALAAQGPHGIPFEHQAAKFHISFIIGDSQPRFQKSERIREAGMSCGYRFQVTQFEASSRQSIVAVKNIGIAPIYYDAFPTVNGVRANQSLIGLQPNESQTFQIDSGGSSPLLTIESDRLVAGQRIEYDANLP